MQSLRASLQPSARPSRRPSLPQRPHTTNISSTLPTIVIDSRPSKRRSHAPLSSELSQAADQNAWKFTNQGLNLLEASIAEYQHRDLSSRHLARQLYIHSMTYLLKGLPSDLTPEEIITLQAACPSSLISTSNTPFSYLSSTHWPDADESAPSLLHRLLAITIVQVFILSSFIWPYLKMLGEKIYVYEREHRLSERALNATVDGLNQVGKRSVSVGTVLFRTGNGKVATMAASGVAWWVQSVAGGVTEGVEEGMAAVGKAEKSKEKDTERKIQSSGETRGTISTAKYR